jgi:hypothetical protein
MVEVGLAVWRSANHRRRWRGGKKQLGPVAIAAAAADGDEATVLGLHRDLVPTVGVASGEVGVVGGGSGGRSIHFGVVGVKKYGL